MLIGEFIHRRLVTPSVIAHSSGKQWRCLTESGSVIYMDVVFIPCCQLMFRILAEHAEFIFPFCFCNMLSFTTCPFSHLQSSSRVFSSHFATIAYVFFRVSPRSSWYIPLPWAILVVITLIIGWFSFSFALFASEALPHPTKKKKKWFYTKMINLFSKTYNSIYIYIHIHLIKLMVL